MKGRNDDSRQPAAVPMVFPRCDEGEIKGLHGNILTGLSRALSDDVDKMTLEGRLPTEREAKWLI